MSRCCSRCRAVCRRRTWRGTGGERVRSHHAGVGLRGPGQSQPTTRRWCGRGWFTAMPRARSSAATSSAPPPTRWRRGSLPATSTWSTPRSARVPAPFCQGIRVDRRSSPAGCLRESALTFWHSQSDGTKMDANASRHNALSHGHAQKIEASSRMWGTGVAQTGQGYRPERGAQQP